MSTPAGTQKPKLDTFTGLRASWQLTQVLVRLMSVGCTHRVRDPIGCRPDFRFAGSRGMALVHLRACDFATCTYEQADAKTPHAESRRLCASLIAQLRQVVTSRGSPGPNNYARWTTGCFCLPRLGPSGGPARPLRRRLKLLGWRLRPLRWHLELLGWRLRPLRWHKQKHSRALSSLRTQSITRESAAPARRPQNKMRDAGPGTESGLEELPTKSGKV